MYDDHGRVNWIDGREAAFDRLVADWTVDLVSHPKGERLCMAYRHVDVSEINARCRSAYRAAGQLQGPDVEVRAVGRGRRAMPEAIRLAAGDRVIFGETLEIAGVSVRNSDMATIEAIGGSPDDPTVRFKLDKGVVLETRWSALVGRRPEGCRSDRRAPRIQHAYCVSIHSSQGLTVGSGNPAARVHGATFVFNSGLGAQSSLVAMTRHVDECHVYVETSRVRDRLISRKAARGILVDRAGRLEAPDAGEIDNGATETATMEEIKAAVLKEVAASEMKRNCMDFAENVREWLEGRELLGAVRDHPKVTAAAVPTMEGEVQEERIPKPARRNRRQAVSAIS